MDRLIYYFVAFVTNIRSMVGLVIPIFSDAADFRNWRPWVKVLVHLIVLGSILFGLYLLTPYLNDLLKTKATNFVKQYYLPLVFILIYLLTWVGYYIWQLLNRSEDAEFPDIEQAWNEALDRLNQAGYRLTDVPLFLVLGKPTSDVDGLFLASKLKIEVRAPMAAEAPIRVFAEKDAVFVTCAGASAWSKFADALADSERLGLTNDATNTTDAGKTITPDQALIGVDLSVREEFYNLLRIQSERALTADEEYRLQEIGDIIKKTGSAQSRRVGLSNTDQMLGTKRLAFLCKLIVRDRQPECPINGALVTIPWVALESEEITRVAIPTLASDITTARSVFAQRYPHYVMVTDLEEAYGFDEFRRGFPSEMLRQRIGQRLPIVPDRDPDELSEMFEKAAEWVRLNVLSSWVIKFLRLEWPPEQRKTQMFVPGYNRKLFAFLHEIYERGPRLGRLLSRGLPSDTQASAAGDLLDALPLIGGCYLAATGREQKDQAFAAGVFDRLTSTQDAVSWSSAALIEDAAYKRIAFSFYFAAMLLSLPTGYAIYRIVTG